MTARRFLTALARGLPAPLDPAEVRRRAEAFGDRPLEDIERELGLPDGAHDHPQRRMGFPKSRYYKLVTARQLAARSKKVERYLERFRR